MRNHPLKVGDCVLVYHDDMYGYVKEVDKINNRYLVRVHALYIQWFERKSLVHYPKE